MEIQTHGFEKEENEHDVVDKVYLDINPCPQQSEVVQSLKNQAGEEWKESFDEAASPRCKWSSLSTS